MADPNKSLLIPPQNIEAEESLLGGALTSENARTQITSLEQEDFYHKGNGLIYEAIRQLIAKGKPVDVLSVADELEHQGKLQVVGGFSYLSELTTKTLYLNNVSEYVSMIREKSILRKLLAFGQKLVESCYAGDQTSEDLLGLMADQLLNIRGNLDRQTLIHIQEILNTTLAELKQVDSQRLAIDSGFPSVNRLLGKLRRQTLNIVAARPAMGKSAFALNIALNVALKNNVVALFSLEMSQSEVGLRFLSSASTIQSQDIKENVKKQDVKQLTQAIQALIETNLYIDDTAASSPSAIRSKCLRLKARTNGKLDLVVVDYLQLMSSDSKPQNRQQEISEISRSLKIMAKDLEVPVIALSQLSRNVESRENKRPMLSDLRESGSIEQDADAVMFLYRDAYYHSESAPSVPEEAELIVAKNRAGETGTIKLNWFSNITTFREQEYYSTREAPRDTGYDPVDQLGDDFLPM